MVGREPVNRHENDMLGRLRVRCLQPHRGRDQQDRTFNFDHESISRSRDSPQRNLRPSRISSPAIVSGFLSAPLHSPSWRVPAPPPPTTPRDIRRQMIPRWPDVHARLRFRRRPACPLRLDLRAHWRRKARLSRRRSRARSKTTLSSAPKTATASKPAMRETALLIPEAAPA